MIISLQGCRVYTMKRWNYEQKCKDGMSDENGCLTDGNGMILKWQTHK